MKVSRLRLCILPFLLLCLSAVTAQENQSSRHDPPGLDQAEFERLHAELQPDQAQPWRTIPWKISLLDAQRLAAEQKKPLFIWAMDGHPLGCT